MTSGVAFLIQPRRQQIVERLRYSSQSRRGPLRDWGQRDIAPKQKPRLDRACRCDLIFAGVGWRRGAHLPRRHSRRKNQHFGTLVHVFELLWTWKTSLGFGKGGKTSLEASEGESRAVKEFFEISTGRVGLAKLLLLKSIASGPCIANHSRQQRLHQPLLLVLL